MKQYYNLPASLPYLDYDSENFLSVSEFFEQCQPWLDVRDLSIIDGLANAGNIDEYVRRAEQVIPEFAEYERGLRTALASARASKLNREYIPNPSVSTGGEIERDCSEALNQPDPLLREQFLDRRRWAKLDDLAVGHFFDIRFLAVYGFKLLLLQRKKSFSRQQGVDRFTAAYNSIWAEIENHVPKSESGAIL